MFRFLIFVILTVMYYSSFAQEENAEITGRVLNDSIPLQYANVAVLNNDSSLENGSISDKNGTFRISNIKYGFKIIRISFLGLETKYFYLKIDKSQYELGDIKLKISKNKLLEVQVNGSVPIYKTEGAKLITNVANSELKDLGSAYDILNKIPGVIIKPDVNNSIEVLGRGDPTIYINNRRLYDTSELSQLQSNKISSIELIRNPGASYGADQKAIIIIHTKTKQDIGYYIQLNGAEIIAKNISAKYNVDFKYQLKDLSFYLSYSYAKTKEHIKEIDSYTISSDTIWDEEFDQPYTYNNRRNKIISSIEWRLVKGQKLSLYYSLELNKIKKNLNSEAIIKANASNYEQIATDEVINQKPVKNLFNVSYIGQINSNLSINSSSDLFLIDSPMKQISEENSTGDSQLVKINSSSKYKLFAEKLFLAIQNQKTFTSQIGMNVTKIEGDGGYKNSFITYDNYLYHNSELQFGVFSNINIKFNKINIAAGLRWEYIDKYYKEDTTSLIRWSNNYFYPNISLGYDFKAIQMSLSASKKAEKPSFNDLNGNNIYINRFLSQHGNQNLKQEEIYLLSYNLSFKFLIFEISYKYTKNPFTSYIENNSATSSHMTLTTINYNHSKDLNAQIILHHKFNFWQPSLYLEYNHPYFKTTYLGSNTIWNTPRFVLKNSNFLLLPFKLRFDVDYTYQSNYNYYAFYIENTSKIDLGIRKNLLKNKLLINFKVNDILNNSDLSSTLKLDEYKNEQYIKRETQKITLSIRYMLDKNNALKSYKNTFSKEINRF